MRSWGKCIGCLKTGISLVDKNLNHILEFGVWKGRTLQLIRDSFDNSFQVFGFDSFMGLPCDWIGGRRKWGSTVPKGHFNTNGEIPDIPDATFFKGWFENTVPEYLSMAQSIGLIHIDSDLYSSAKTILFNLNDFIVKIPSWFLMNGDMVLIKNLIMKNKLSMNGQKNLIENMNFQNFLIGINQIWNNIWLKYYNNRMERYVEYRCWWTEK